MAIDVVKGLRAIAAAYPQTTPKITQINNLMREVMLTMMQGAQTPEPQAPPTNG